MKGERDRAAGGTGVLRLLGEWLLITVVFAAAGAWPVPDVNEAHYLAKARHAADPAWCVGDFFLESVGAHGLFFQLLGPLAASVSLSTAAWVGRWAGWALLAAGFRHAAGPLLPAGWQRIVAAAVFSLAVRSTTMAGEWVIGGCEAKVFAWAAVLVAWGESVSGRWPSAWLWGGLAAAFHPLVGGWMMIVTVLAGGGGELLRPSARTLACLAGGLAAAAIGFVPAVMLTAGVPAEVQAEAARIYVVDRLPHHLLPQRFAEPLVCRHLLVIFLWAVVNAGLPDSTAKRTAANLTLSTFGLSASGWLLGLAAAVAPDLAHRLLRYYWFRLGDVLVPLALAIVTVMALWPTSGTAGGRLSGRWQRGLRVGLSGLLVLDLLVQSCHWPLPGRQLVARSDKHVQTPAWDDACGWIARNTPPDACFLTPRGAASFNWQAERPEVVAWKNIPQDPRGIIEWRQRILDCFSADGSLRGMARSTASLGQQRLEEVARRYRADYLLAPRGSVIESGITLPQVYANEAYVVLQLPDHPDRPISETP